MILLGHDEAVAGWVGKICGKPFARFDAAIGVIDGQGTLTGGFVFTGFNGDCIELSLAGRGVRARDTWRGVLSYVFDQLKCSRMQMHTRYSNKAVKKMLPELGMKFEGIARRFYGKEHGVVFSLTRDDLPAFRARWRL